MERRTLNLNEIKVSTRQDEEKETRYIEGHAAVFNSWSETLGGILPFKERVLKGAFTESLSQDDIRALFNHNPDYVLGRNKSGTLSLEEDDSGLRVKVTPPETQWANDLLISINRGDINQMSFGFIVEEDRWGVEDDLEIRELVKVKLFDVSPVTFPAYPETDVGVRSALKSYEDYRKDKKGWRLPLWKHKLQLLK